jgi:hypothetical protein
MARLAFMTIGVLHAPMDDPRVQGFVDRIDVIFAAAGSSDGFVGQSVPDEATGEESWGPLVTPTHFQKEEYLDRTAATLSLWNDLESVFAFAYNGVHAEALRKRAAWIVHGEWPSYVAWWVSDDHTPSWSEACERYDRMCQEGPSPAAFDFKRPFSHDGEPIEIDRAIVGRKIAQAGQEGLPV